VSEVIDNPLANVSEVIGNALAYVSEVIGNALANLSRVIGNPLTNLFQGVGKNWQLLQIAHIILKELQIPPNPLPEIIMYPLEMAKTLDTSKDICNRAAQLYVISLKNKKVKIKIQEATES
jgi:hypothetical protein